MCGAGYEILLKYKEQFYPYIIYSNPELALDLVGKDLSTKNYQILLFLRKGYKIRDFDYGNNDRVYNIIERKELIMIIKCYLFSDRTRQLGHTYYSTGMGSYLYFELSSYQDTAHISSPFVYEVEVDTDKILYCDSESVRSIEYKISREVKFNEYIFTFTLPKNDLKELLNILDGNIDKNEMIEFYTSIISKDVYKVNRFDQLKFFAILNQTKYELPEATIEKEFQMDYYVKLLIYYNKPYQAICKHSAKISGFRKELNKQRMRGTTTFETISDKISERLAYNYFLDEYILNRQLTQEQFESLCEYFKRNTHIFKFRIKLCSIAAGYKILPEYNSLFYPFVLYHGVEEHLDLIIKGKQSDELLKILFNCGYKFKNVDYSDMPSHDKITEAKIIFQKGFKYIE